MREDDERQPVAVNFALLRRKHCEGTECNWRGLIGGRIPDCGVIAGPLASAGTVRNLRPAAAAGAVLMTAASSPINPCRHIVALLIERSLTINLRSVQRKVNFGSAVGHRTKPL